MTGSQTGDRLCRSKEGLCSSKVTMLIEHHVDQRAIAIERAIQILPMVVRTYIQDEGFI